MEVSGGEDMVTVPVSSLPKEYVEKNLVKKAPIPDDAIPKRHAAIEVMKARNSLRLMSLIGIGGVWVSLILSLISPYAVAGVALVLTLFVGYNFIRNDKEINYLRGEYRI